MKHDKIDPNAPAMPVTAEVRYDASGKPISTNLCGGLPIRFAAALRIMQGFAAQPDASPPADPAVPIDQQRRRYADGAAHIALIWADALLDAYNEEAG